MEWKISFAAVLLLIFALFIPLLPANAAVAFNVQINTNGKAVIPNYGSYVNFSASLFATRVFSLAKYVNFSNAALTATSNPTQSFGVATSTSGATVMVNAITSDHLEFKEYFSGGNALLYISYVMPGGISYTYPQNIQITYGTFTQTLSYPYLTQAYALVSCTAPCAYLNQVNNTMIVKGLNSPNVIDLWFSPAPGASVSNPSGQTTPTTTPTTTPPSITIPTTNPPQGGSGGGGNGALASAAAAVSDAIISAAQSLPTITPASVGNPSLNLLAEITLFSIFVLIIAAVYLARPRGRIGGGRMREPKVTVGPTNSNTIFNFGWSREPQVKAARSRPREPRVNIPKTKEPNMISASLFRKDRKREYELP